MITFFNEKIAIRLIIIFLVFFSCSCNNGNKGDIYVGNYSAEYNSYAEIVKAGKLGYFVKVKIGSTTYIEHCTFEDDCFVYKRDSNKTPFLCKLDENKLVFDDGTTFFRKFN